MSDFQSREETITTYNDIESPFTCMLIIIISLEKFSLDCFDNRAQSK